MCGVSKIEFNGNKIDMFFGYPASYININDIVFGKLLYDQSCTREEIAGELSKFSKEQLIDIIIELAEHGDED